MTLNDIASTVTSKLPPGWEYWAVWSSAIIATIISLCHIISHLQIYSKPSQQRLIVRISCVIPIYGLTAALSFQFPAAILYFAAVRDIAEAFVIYSFLNLLYDYLGGEGAILNAINGVPIQGSWWSCTCCLSGTPFTIATLRFCKKATLQFCGVRPITSILEVILYECGFYTLEKSFSLHSAPLFITIIYNISITLALYGLALFYMSTKKLLAPQNPLLKFISVKGIILFAYWQTLLLSILAQFDYLEHPGAEQALLTALESVPSAILVAAAFPVKPYIQGYSTTGGSNDRLKQISVSMKDTVNPKDIIQDVVHNFSSRYRGYAQYHNIQGAALTLPESSDNRLMTNSDDEQLI